MRMWEGKDLKNDRLKILDEQAEEKWEREELRAQEAKRPSMFFFSLNTPKLSCLLLTILSMFLSIESVLQQLHNQWMTIDNLIKKLTAGTSHEGSWLTPISFSY